jgi:hypothetical protein
MKEMASQAMRLLLIFLIGLLGVHTYASQYLRQQQA